MPNFRYDFEHSPEEEDAKKDWRLWVHGKCLSILGTFFHAYPALMQICLDDDESVAVREMALDPTVLPSHCALQAEFRKHRTRRELKVPAVYQLYINLHTIVFFKVFVVVDVVDLRFCWERFGEDTLGLK